MDNVLKKDQKIEIDSTAPDSLSSLFSADLQKYESRITTSFGAFKNIHNGDTVFIASACAEPQYLLRQLQEYAPKINDVQLIHLLGSGRVNFNDPKYADHIRYNCFFIGSSTRSAVASGLADYTPVRLSEIPEMMRRRQVKVDVALLQVSPPDERGLCCLGVSVETVKAAAENARYVIAQVNPRMPVVGGDSRIPVELIDALVPYEEDLLEFEWPAPSAVANEIAFHVAGLVDNGATVQLGIGKIQSAVARNLCNKTDLGIHTEMFSDNIIDLIECGAVTNRRKGIHDGKVVATFCVGTKRLYEYIHNNPIFELYPAEYAGQPSVISKNHKLTAINGALEIDLTGQVCSDSVGHQFYSGFGSQLDFMRGAARSEGGKPIIVMPSTAKNGAVSRIVPTLSPGSGVVLTRGDVHYVVTEYGISYLYGKNIRERALALIEIAHPKFRQELLERAKELNYLYPDQKLPSDSHFVYPHHWTKTVRLKDGGIIRLRPIRPRDESMLQSLYYSLSDGDIFLRFMASDPRFPHRRMLPETTVDHCDQVGIIAAVGEPGREEIVGAAAYGRNPNNNTAECGFTVKNDHRRRGIGREMLMHLTDIAKKNGITGFRVEVLAKNRPMLNLFYRALGETRTKDGMHTTLEDGVYSLWYLFANGEEEQGPHADGESPAK